LYVLSALKLNMKNDEYVYEDLQTNPFNYSTTTQGTRIKQRLLMPELYRY